MQHHALLAALKGYCTTKASIAIEHCRLACGGHGFSLASGLPQLYTLMTGSLTAEGEATVMLLQAARLLYCIFHRYQYIHHKKLISNQCMYVYMYV